MPSPDAAAHPAGGSAPGVSAGRIDRRSLVERHRVEAAGIDPGSALSVGNGELCLTVDATGLQTFPEHYPVADPASTAPGTLLGTQSQWGWHSTPRPDSADLARAVRPYRTARGDVGYVDAPPMDGSDDSALDEGSRWLRANPHRLDLARIGLVLPAARGHRAPRAGELGRCHQVLDLWTGVIRSEFALGDRSLRVHTACHPGEDTVAFRIERTSGEPGSGVRIAFPYGSQSWSGAADWSSPGAHADDVERRPDGVLVRRRFDGAPDPLYRVRVRVSPQAAVARSGEHELVVTTDAEVLDVAVTFAEGAGADPAGSAADAVFAASREHWPRFWERGAALDLAGSTDPRAAELERRAVLSQYLTAIQCAGSLPPQETGLTCNSWRGRFHLEMHWWHAAHFPLWGRPELLLRSMGFYRRILPRARHTAAVQGYSGARWPKQVGPEGRESPSAIGPFLLWQQPHVIHLAELLRRAGAEPGEFAELVEQTAHFMADFAEPTAEGFSLGPPLVPAQESYADLRDRAHDPPFELAYWAWALGVAQTWRTRSGAAREPHWDEVRTGMRRPLVRDGRYAAIPVEPFTVRTDHPSMVYALGPVPAGDVADPEVVRATLHDVLADWDWESAWGWDFPALAMAAARLGEPDTAVDVLLLDTPKNRHLPNGHNRQHAALPLYLPGNGGLLAALALMAGGFDGDGGAASPGFPRDGAWTVRHEGFVRSP
ncbi:hypothetical protein [Streptomonospora litoralis]|uniref:Glycoside hydrolase family 65 n=1 Tax=Streptomonospora litoralis TaxID=2498135 RepID=A0A4P6PVI4_9ACTN|nr:hypothetical protein [Streptomonospora litoralis]QBI52158.1 hypothetical protein EKD16_01705 [Streptomonospora litoralis]